MGKSGGSPKVQVTDYYMGIHYGIGISVDSIQGIYVGEKAAWEGNITDEGPISINAPNLFGGNKKEGGCVGTAYFLPGGDDQVLPEYLASKLGLTSATAPAYRGISSVWFHGTTGSYDWETGEYYSWGGGGLGFLWSSNNPYLRDIWMKVSRAPKGLNDYLSSMIGAARTVSTYRNTVTVDGTSGTVVQGTPSTINGALVLLNRKSLTIDGTEIIVDLDDTNADTEGHARRRGTVSVGGVSLPLALGASILTVNGWTISINGVYSVSLGPGSIKVANFTARENARIDANPIHIVYECMTNDDWGMGGAPSSFDTANFLAAAQTIHDEGFGMSLTWANQTTVESFVGDIIDHIQATIFINPRTGLWTIKLIRDDYDVDTLPVLNRDNCEITSFSRKAWAETTNEIVVTWTNPATEKEETVIAQDLANIGIQGAVISDSRNYHGIRNATLAMKVAKRDLRVASAPLAIFEIQVNRDAWDFVPGGVVKLDYDEPDYDIESAVLRISKIDYGRPGDQTIKINAVEDIFSLPIAAYRDPPTTAWVEPSETPRPFDFSTVITAPLYFTTEALTAASLSSFEFPEVMTMVLATQTGNDTFSFDLLAQRSTPSGDTVTDNFGTMNTIGHATTVAPMVAEVTTTGFAFANGFGSLPPAINRFLFIGSGETSMEIALIIGGDDITGWTLKRGLLDTVPRAWPNGTPIWLLNVSSNLFDETARSGGEVVNYKLLSRTSKGVLAEVDAPVLSTTLTERPWLPNRPGNVKVGGTAFGTVNIGDATSADVTWANRNRLMEPTAVIAWDEGSITPEDGQTTRITVMKSDRTVLAVHSGLTGTSYTLSATDFAGNTSGIVRVTAERDGLESLQGHEITVTLTARGYGFNYGNFYGG